MGQLVGNQAWDDCMDSSAFILVPYSIHGNAHEISGLR